MFPAVLKFMLACLEVASEIAQPVSAVPAGATARKLVSHVGVLRPDVFKEKKVSLELGVFAERA